MGSPIVLCIDDSSEQLELRIASLEASGFCVKTATNGYAAIKMLEEVSVDAVLLEYKEEGTRKPSPITSTKGFPTCRSSCSQPTLKCLSGFCGWWMNT